MAPPPAETAGSKKDAQKALQVIAKRSKARAEASKIAGKKRRLAVSSSSTGEVDATPADRLRLRQKLRCMVTKADLAAVAASTTSADKGKKGAEAAVVVEAAGDRPVPAMGHEVHVKKQQITVKVILHKVPPQFVDVSKTTSKMLVIDTGKWTKKYLLRWPFPHGMEVDAAAAEYEFDSGILKCVFAVKKMPKVVEAEWNDRLTSIRTTQRSRLVPVVQDGELKVRVKTMQMKRPRGEGEGVPPPGSSGAGKPAVEGANDDDDDSPPAAKKKFGAGVEPKKGAGAAGAGSGSRTQPQGSNVAVRSDAAAAAAKKQKAPTSDADMVRIAKEAGKASEDTLKQRLARAREMHRARVAKSQVRDSRKDTKQHSEQANLRRVLEEQQLKLEKQRERISDEPINKPKGKAPGGAAHPQAHSSPAKSVRFSK